MKRNVPSILFALLWSCYGAFVSAQPLPVTLDGSITYFERFDTTHTKPRTFANDDILVRKDSNFYYIGIRNGVIGASNLVIWHGDSCTVLHISGSATRAVYRVFAKDSLAIRRPILWITKSPEAWEFKGKLYYERILKQPRTDAAITAELFECLKQHGYAATTIDMGSMLDTEVVLSRSRFKGAKVIIQYLKQIIPSGTLQTSFALYPTQPLLSMRISDVQRFFAAEPGTALTLPLSGMEWWGLD